jgi:YVTN family beta-propeller protein
MKTYRVRAAAAFKAGKFTLARCVALMVSLSIVVSNFCLSAAATQLNLSSTAHNFSAPVAAIINVGGHTFSISQGQMLTPAEYVALNQVLQSGQQQLVLGAAGTAVGGIFNVSSGGGSLSGLTIPHGVTALDNSTNSGLSLTGDLSNAGRLFAFSTGGSTASIQALDVINQKGGLISSILPTGNFGLLNTISNLGLSLNAINNFTNLGTISSAGDLSISAGNSITNSGTPSLLQAAGSVNLSGSNITNSGSIITQTGNVNIVNASSNNLIFNNTNGTVQAINQSININNGSPTSQTNIVLTGGNFLSKQLDVSAGEGNITIDAKNITGLMNTQAANVNVQASTANLQIGDTNVSGDPTFFNTSGSITIDSALTFSGQALAIVASGNITAASGGSINTSNASATTSGDGGAVTLIAGAKFTTTGGGTGTGSLTSESTTGDQTSTLTITGGSSTGGSINLTNLSSPLNTSSSDGSGGNVTLVAFAGSASGAGTITQPTTLSINTAGSSGSQNGNVLMIAGAKTGTALTVGTINAAGSGASGGNVSLFAATPAVASNTTITNGVVTGSFSPGALTAGGITFGSGASITNGGTFTASTAGAFDSSAGNINSTGNVAITSTGSTITSGLITTSGTAALTSAGTLTVAGQINAGGNISLTTTAKNSNIFVDANVVSSNGSVTASANGTGSIEMLNQVTNNITLPAPTIPVPSVNNEIVDFPLGAVTTPDGKFLFVPDFGQNQVYIINTANGGSVVGDVGNTLSGGFNTPQGTVIVPGTTAGTGTLFVGNYNAKTITVVPFSETTSGSSTSISANASSTITLPSNPEAMAVGNNGMLYVVTDSGATLATPGAESLVEVNASTGAVVRTIPLGTNLGQTGGIVINPQGTLAYVTESGSKAISVINLTTNTVQKTIDLSSFGSLNPISVAMNPSGTQIYVTEGSVSNGVISGAVAVINTLPTSKTFDQVVSTTNFGSSNGQPGFFPQGITVNATGTEVFTQTTFGASTNPSVASKPNTTDIFANTSPGLSIGINTGAGTDGIGSSTWSTVVNNNGVNNLTTFTGNTNNFLPTAPATVSVVQEPTIQGHNVTLTAGGLIVGSYAAVNDGTLTVNATGKNSQVILNNVGSTASFVGPSKSTGTFEIGSLQPLTISGNITSPNVILQTTANLTNSGTSTLPLNITIGSGSQATIVGQAGGTVQINANGSIIQGNNSSSIIGATISLNTVNGNIGATGSGGAINTATANISVNTSGPALINNTGAVTINNSIAQTFSITNSGTITLSSSASINALSISLITTNNGSIILNSQLGLGTTIGNTISLTAGGSGSIKEAAGTFVITADTLNLSSGSGAIGSATAPLRTLVNSLGFVGTQGNSASSAFVVNNSATNLTATSVSNVLSVVSSGDLTLSGAAGSTKTMTLQTLGGGNINISSTVAVGSNNPSSTVTLISSGEIADVNSTSISTGLLSMQTSGGDIGSSAANILTSAANLQTSTLGNTFINASNSSATNGYTVGVNASSAGIAYQLIAAGNVLINGAISAPLVAINTTASTGTSQIVIGANVGQVGPPTTSNVVTLATAGATGKDDSIIFKSGNILSPITNLSVTNGSIGTSAAPVQLTTQFLSANAPSSSGNVFIRNSIATNFSANSGAGGTFSLVSGSNLTVDEGITAKTVNLQTLNNGSITVEDNILGSTSTSSVTLNANGSGGLFTSSGSVQAANISLISGTGGIGAINNDFNASGAAGATGTVSVSTGGSAFLNLTNATPTNATPMTQNLGTAVVGSKGLLFVGSLDTPINVTGAVTANNIQMNVTGGLTVGAALNAPTINLVGTGGNITINSTVGQAKGVVTISTTDDSNIEGGAKSSIIGSSVSLSSTAGNIGDLLSVGVSSTAVSVSAPGGSASLTGSGAVTLNSVSTSGAFSLGGSSALTTNGTINAGSITLSGSSITLGAIGVSTSGAFSLVGSSTLTTKGTINAGSITLSGSSIILGASIAVGSTGTVALTATGATGQIAVSNNSVSISAGTVSLTTAKGNIGSSTLPVVTVTPSAATNLDLNLTSNGQAFVSNIGNVQTGSNAFNGTALTLNANGSITTTGTINSKSVTINANGGGLTVDPNIGQAGATVSLSGSSGVFSSTFMGTSAITGNTVKLVSGAANIGTSTLSIPTNATTLTLQNLSGNAFINNTGTGALSLLSAGSFGTYQVATGGNLTVASGISATSPTLIAGTAGNGSIFVAAGMVVGTGASGSVDTITANGTGTITNTNNSGFIGVTVNLNTDKGNIGTSSVPALFIALDVNVSTAQSSGASANLINVGKGDPLSITGAVGGSLTLSTEGSSLTIGSISLGPTTGTGAGNNLTLIQQSTGSTSASDISLTGSINVNGGNINIVQGSPGGSFATTGAISTTAGSISLVQEGIGAMTINGNVTANGGSILIQNTNTATGTIGLGTTNPSTTIQTSVSSTGTPTSTGNISVVIGKLPVQAVNGGQTNFPSGVTVTPSGGANAFAGPNKGAIVAGGTSPGVTLNAAGRDIVFSSPTAADTITLGNGLTIKASGATTPVAFKTGQGNESDEVIVDTAEDAI